MSEPKDRFRYFRIEARELLDALSRGVLDLEKAPADRALVARLLRHAHTLKGAARVVGQAGIGELAHAAEDVLGPHRDEGAPPVPRERIDALLRTLDAAATAVSALDPAPRPEAQPAAAPAAAPLEEAVESVRVDLAELDATLGALVEAAVQVTALRRQLGRLDLARDLAQALADGLSPRGGGEPVGAAGRLRPMADELRRAIGDAQRALGARADEAERELTAVRSSADRLRLLPARGLFGTLERAARDAARSVDREVTFQAAGGDVRVDAHVLAAVREALLHVVRNAVAHGIEPAAERARRGKPRAGLVRLEVRRRGHRVAFTCRDDGRGLDAEAIRASAERKGLLAPGQPADDAEVARLVLRSGVSTSAAVTDLAGRGVGLDVVRDVAARLKADLALRSTAGAGTEVELAVPLSLTAMTALHVEGAGAVAAVPLDDVARTAFVEASSLARTPDGARVAVDGALVPFVPLARVLGRAAPRDAKRPWSAVIVRAGGRTVALGADRLLGTGDIVVRPLPPFLDADPAVAGAALDAEGTPHLVLDPEGLLAAALGGAPREEAPRPPPPILVIDDSLTTRMLEESILTSAGYEVELAVSAEEALERARARRFGLFVVDVEMPGMDGFEFVRVTRADPRLAPIPAILVTSRGAPEDRQRGLDAGASAYIVKGDFDQGRLLATIRELLE